MGKSHRPPAEKRSSAASNAQREHGLSRIVRCGPCRDHRRRAAPANQESHRASGGRPNLPTGLQSQASRRQGQILPDSCRGLSHRFCFRAWRRDVRALPEPKRNIPLLSLRRSSTFPAPPNRCISALTRPGGTHDNSPTPKAFGVGLARERRKVPKGQLNLCAGNSETTQISAHSQNRLPHLTYLTLAAASPALGPSPKIMPQHFRPPPAYLPRVLRPPPLPPIPITTRLRRQQMEQRLAIRLATPVHRLTVQLFVKLRAQLVHRVQHIFIAANPAQIARPRSALKMEPMIALLRLLNRLGHALGCRIGSRPLPDRRLMQWLHRLEIL